jgi:CoA:oxalate CoA-transferase
VGTSIGDIIAGHQAAIGIMAALIHREKTGRGQHYDGSMVDGLFAALENAVVRYTLTGQAPAPLGGMHPAITPFQSLRTKDSWIVIAIGNDALWKRFCSILSREDLIDDPRFQTNHVRCENKENLSDVLEMEMKKKTTREWIAIFEAADLPYAPINNIKDICEDPIIAHRGMLTELDQPVAGKMRIAGSPIRLSETPGEVRFPAPLLGQHSAEILKDLLGLSGEEIEQLREEGIINR